MEIMYNKELIEINGGELGILDLIKLYPIIDAVYSDTKRGLKDFAHNCATAYNS